MTLADPRISCVSCGLENAANARFCKNCGKSLSAMSCPDCGAEFKADQKFCAKCGAALPADKSCSACGCANPAHATMCSHCGAPLNLPIEKAPLEPTGAEEDSLDHPLQRLTEDDPDSGSTEKFGSFVRTPIRAPTKDNSSANWIARSLPLLKENPRAIWKIVAALVVVAAFSIGAFWYFGRESALPVSVPVGQNAETFSGVLYAVRLTHIRNAPTSIGTVVVGEIEAGRAISGTWVLGRDGLTRWLRIQLQNGNYGFVWGKNLSSAPVNSGPATSSITLMRDQSINVSTGQINPGPAADFVLTGDRPNQTDAEEKTMNLRSLNGGPNAADSARSAVMTTAEPGYQGCSTAPFSDDVVGVSAMPLGTWFCLKGTDGQLAEMRLEQVLDSPDGIRIALIPLH